MTMARLLAACGAFLLGVLWMDLMFDVQVRHAPDAAAVASIAAYYRRVTTEAFPMNRMIAAAMVVTLVGSVFQLVRPPAGRKRALLATLLGGTPIVLAATRVVPNAVRLGTGTDDAATQAALAQTILHDHLLCFAAMLAFTALQLGTRRRD